MVGEPLSAAVFLDRDGIINKLVYNPQSGEYESPLAVEQVELLPEVKVALPG